MRHSFPRRETVVRASRDLSPTVWRTTHVSVSACPHHTPINRVRDQALRTAPVMLLCLSSVRWGSVLEEPVEAAGEVAFEAAVCFAAGLAFADAPFDVGDRGGVCAASGDEDLLQGPVELSVAAAVESVADRLS